MSGSDKPVIVVMPSQQGAKPTIGGGHPSSPQVMPGGKVVNATLSVTGDTPGHWSIDITTMLDVNKLHVLYL